LRDRDVAGQIRRNDHFLRDTFGVHAAPYLRPPYGFHDKRTDRIAADLGYDLITMWYGTLGDGTSSITAEPRSSRAGGNGSMPGTSSSDTPTRTRSPTSTVSYWTSSGAGG